MISAAKRECNFSKMLLQGEVLTCFQILVCQPNSMAQWLATSEQLIDSPGILEKCTD